MPRSTMMRSIGTLAVFVVVAASATSRRPALPGDLPHQIGSMQSRELYSFAEALSWQPGPPQIRRCKGTPGCDNNSASINAMMYGVRGQANVGPGAIGQYGTIVAKMTNLGGKPTDPAERKYGLKAGTFTYYLIALPAGGNSWTWSLREVSGEGSTTLATEVARGNWIACRHAQHPGHPAMFIGCNEQGAAPKEDAHGPNASSDHLLAGLPDDPLSPAWLTCSDGCCTAGT